MEHKDVPYIVHEGIMTRLERTIERLWILAIILIILLFGSNAGWVYYESQFSDTTTTIETEQTATSDEGNAIINDGVHINDGEGNTKGQDNKENPNP